MKTIYLVRHAIAAEPGPDYPTDDVRPLTDDRIARLTRQVSGLGALDVAVDVILTSPLVRCRQTAQILSEGLASHPPVEVLDPLRPGGRIAEVLAGLGPYRQAGAVALVVHEPSIGVLAATLIGAQGTVEFKKGAVCRVDVAGLPPRGAGTLVWMLPPKVLRRLGG